MRQLDDEGMTQVVVTHEMRFAREVADQNPRPRRRRADRGGAAPEVIFSAPRDGRTRDFLSQRLSLMATPPFPPPLFKRLETTKHAKITKHTK